jgi:hypothetical protein
MTTTRRRVVDVAIAKYDTPVVGRCPSATTRRPLCLHLVLGLRDYGCRRRVVNNQSKRRTVVQLSFAIIVGMALLTVDCCRHGV